MVGCFSCKLVTSERPPQKLFTQTYPSLNPTLIGSLHWGDFNPFPQPYFPNKKEEAASRLTAHERPVFGCFYLLTSPPLSGRPRTESNRHVTRIETAAGRGGIRGCENEYGINFTPDLTRKTGWGWIGGWGEIALSRGAEYSSDPGSWTMPKAYNWHFFWRPAQSVWHIMTDVSRTVWGKG